jgi:hypothetical protein
MRCAAPLPDFLSKPAWFLLGHITFACTVKRNLECASHACAFFAHSHAVGRLWAKHGFTR